MIPSNPTPASVFASVAGRYDLIFWYDACDTNDPWKKYDPNAPPIANDLTAISTAQGLWIKANADATWIVTGTASSQVTIPLCAGQNLISFPSIGATPLPEALSSIAGKFGKVYAYDSTDVSAPW